MLRIEIDLSYLKLLSWKLDNQARQIRNAKEDFRTTMEDLDWEVKSKENISSRANKLVQKLDDLVNILYTYKDFVDAADEEYKRLENDSSWESDLPEVTVVPKPVVPETPKTPTGYVYDASPVDIEEYKARANSNANNKTGINKEKSEKEKPDIVRPQMEEIDYNDMNIPEARENYQNQLDDKINGYRQELNTAINKSLDSEWKNTTDSELSDRLLKKIEWSSKPSSDVATERIIDEINKKIADAVALKMMDSIVDEYDTDSIGLTKQVYNQIKIALSDMDSIKTRDYVITFPMMWTPDGSATGLIEVKFLTGNNKGKSYQIPLGFIDEKLTQDYEKKLKKLGKDEIKYASYELLRAWAKGFVKTEVDVNTVKGEAVSLIAALTDEKDFEKLVDLADGKLENFLKDEGKEGLKKIVKELRNGDEILKAASKIEKLQGIKNDLDEAIGNNKSTRVIENIIKKAESEDKKNKTSILSD